MVPPAKETPVDRTERVRSAVRDSIAACNGAVPMVEEFTDRIARLPPLSSPPVEPAPREPEPTGAVLAYAQMTRLRALMGDRSPVAYARAQNEAAEVLWAEIRELATYDQDLMQQAEDAAYAMGERLHALKRRKPEGLTWDAYLKDQKCPFGRSRADEHIQVFLGQTTVQLLKEKKAAGMRKVRAKAPPRGGKRTVVSKRKISPNGSACAINWEDYKEDGQTDADARRNAVAWQLHEGERLAREFALLRPGTQRSEIKKATLRKIEAIIAAWRRLHKQLSQRIEK